MSRRGVYKDGFQALNEYTEAIELPIGSGVAVSKGDVITITSGYIALATTLATSAGVYYVAMGECTAAEASANGALNILCIPISDPTVRYMVPVTADAILAQATHVGNAYNLDGSEDGITVAAAVTADWGFRIKEIDISADAVAVETYGYAIGRFQMFSETT